MKYYYASEMVWIFRSRIDRARKFDSADEARKFDRQWAREIVADVSAADFEAAFEQRDDRLVAALKVLADETDVQETLAESQS